MIIIQFILSALSVGWGDALLLQRHCHTGWVSEQPGAVKGVPAHGRVLEQDDL